MIRKSPNYHPSLNWHSHQFYIRMQDMVLQFCLQSQTWWWMIKSKSSDVLTQHAPIYQNWSAFQVMISPTLALTKVSVSGEMTVWWEMAFLCQAYKTFKSPLGWCLVKVVFLQLWPGCLMRTDPSNKMLVSGRV